MRTLTRNLSLVVLSATLSAAAQAADVFDLRALSAQANWAAGSNPDNAALRYGDWFNNGDPQTGGVFFPNALTAPASLYTPTGSTTGAETTPGDISLDGTPLGQFRFSRGNATGPLDFNFDGAAFTLFNQYLRLNAPTRIDPTTGATITVNLLNNTRSNFAASAAFDFASPDAGTLYGMRLTDGNIGDPGFDDLISLDVVHSALGGDLRLRRVAGNESDGMRFITQTELRSVTSGLYGGYSLADVDLVAMHMYWFPSTGVEAEVELLKIAGGGSTITQVGLVKFDNRYSIFNGENFTRLQAGATWVDAAPPIPEPSTYALMAGGLLAVGWAARRRRKS